jgi:hypothetical protein
MMGVVRLALSSFPCTTRAQIFPLSTYLFFAHPSERACHPERSAPQARDAKDLLVGLHRRHDIGFLNSRSLRCAQGKLFAPWALRMTTLRRSLGNKEKRDLLL